MANHPSSASAESRTIQSTSSILKLAHNIIWRNKNPEGIAIRFFTQNSGIDIELSRRISTIGARL